MGFYHPSRSQGRVPSQVNGTHAGSVWKRRMKHTSLCGLHRNRNIYLQSRVSAVMGPSWTNRIGSIVQPDTLKFNACPSHVYEQHNTSQYVSINFYIYICINTWINLKSPATTWDLVPLMLCSQTELASGVHSADEIPSYCMSSCVDLTTQKYQEPM